MHIDKHAAAVAVPLANVANWMFRFRGAERQLDKAVIKARSKGATWAEIAEAVEMSPQGAYGRWSGKAEAAGVSADVASTQGVRRARVSTT
jgi:hypothetical protein